MTIEQAATAKAALTMLLKNVSPFEEILDFKKITIVGQGPSTPSAQMLVEVTSRSTDVAVIGQAKLNFLVALERQCFEIFQHRGYLLIPTVLIASA